MLIVETGQIVAGANTYVTIDEVTEYLEARAKADEWTCVNVDEQEGALLYATLFFESRWRFKGYMQSIDQQLAFPRTPFYDREGRVLAGEGIIPQAIKDAIAELALIHIKYDLFLHDPAGAKIKSESLAGRNVTIREAVSDQVKVVSFIIRDYRKGSSMMVELKR